MNCPTFYLIPSFIWHLLCNLGHELCIDPMVCFSISVPATHCKLHLAYIKPWHLLEHVTSTYSFPGMFRPYSINFIISWASSKTNPDEILTGTAFESTDQLEDKWHIHNFKTFNPQTRSFLLFYPFYVPVVTIIFHTGSYKSRSRFISTWDIKYFMFFDALYLVNYTIL